MYYNSIKTNFHTHTIFCGHAHNLPIDFLDKIDELEIETLGFSEHAYIDVPGFKHTIKTPRLMNKYYKEVMKLKLNTCIEVLAGLEVDYFPKFNSYYKKLYDKFDYLTLSVHFVEFNGTLPYGTRFNYIEEMKLYCEYMEEGLKSGLFVFVNHPDLFLNDYMNEYRKTDDIKKCENDVIDLALKYNTPIELNIAQFRRYRNLYEPDNIRDDFWTLVGKKGARVIVNFDAHDKEELDLNYYNLVMNYANNHNLNIIFDFRESN